MRKPDVVFADNGIRVIRRYGGTSPEGSAQAWRGMCAETRARSGAFSGHVFADGTDLLSDQRVRLGVTAAEQARAVLTGPAGPARADPPPAADRELRRLAGHRQVILTWASACQRVAVGDADQLVTDDRFLCTVEVTSMRDPSCTEVVRWDPADVGGNLVRIDVATARVCALAALPAAEPPAAACDLVLEPGYAGPFFHELLGHPLEADIVAARASYLSDRFGEMVAPAWLTVTDGPPPRADGGPSVRVDDEGTPVSTVELIGGGRVTGMLSDRPSAALAGRVSNGHGRRLDYRHPVIPRMWHTTAHAAGTPAQEPGAVRLAPRGLRLRRMNLITGDFEFTAETAALDAGTGRRYRTGPCTVTGNALTVLAALRPGAAEIRTAARATKGCGKLGQFPLVTTFANGGLWIPAEAVHVRSDPAR